MGRPCTLAGVIASALLLLSEQQARDIHAWLISRAHETWGSELPPEEDE